MRQMDSDNAPREVLFDDCCILNLYFHGQRGVATSVVAKMGGWRLKGEHPFISPA